MNQIENVKNANDRNFVSKCLNNAIWIIILLHYKP